MPCGCARTRMSSSSTTTSDPHRSTNPWIRRGSGGSRFSGRLDRVRVPAGIPQEIRSRCRLMPKMEHARTLEFPRSAQKSISIPEQVVAVARRPGEAHMASRLFEIVTGTVRLAGAS